MTDVSVPVATARVRGARSSSVFVPLAFLAPSLLLLAVFFLAPLALTGWMSLNDWPLLGTSHFNGLGNYTELARDSIFWGSVWFTTKYTLIVTPLIFVVGFCLALLVNARLPGVGIFRTAYFVPAVIGFGTASFLWFWMFNDQVGIFNGILLRLGLIQQPIEWLGDPTRAFLAVIVMVVWKTAGLTMLLLLVGMQGIPEELYDAAALDGAGRFATIRYITLPLLRRTIALTLTLSVIGSYLAFDQFFIMTQGGPGNSTLTIVYWIYHNSFVSYRLGYGAALSIVLLAILIVISTTQLALLRGRVDY
jgi:multiple sugar transport system permease protein